MVTLMVVLCLAGAWISGELLKTHAGRWTAPTDEGLFAQLCSSADGGRASCTEAARTSWSQIALPSFARTSSQGAQLSIVVVPIAFLGLSYFVMLGAWLAAIGPTRGGASPWRWYPLTLTAAGGVVSLFYLCVMGFGIAPHCWWCTIVHVINITLVTMVWLTLRAKASLSQSSLRPSDAFLRLRTREALCTTGFSCAVVLMMWLYYSTNVTLQDQWRRLSPYKRYVKSLAANPEFLLWEHLDQARFDIPSRNEAGDRRASLVVFIDYQCPKCRCAFGEFQKDFLPSWRGHLNVSVRHYPLCRECNGHVTGTGHPSACAASYAAEAARLQGGDRAFRGMHNLLSADPDRLNSDSYRRFAETIGLDGDLLLKDMASPEIKRIIASDIALAQKLGIQGVPSMWLNGRRVSFLAASSPAFWETMAKRESDGPADNALAGRVAPSEKTVTE